MHSVIMEEKEEDEDEDDKEENEEQNKDEGFVRYEEESEIRLTGKKTEKLGQSQLSNNQSMQEQAFDAEEERRNFDNYLSNIDGHVEEVKPNNDDSHFSGDRSFLRLNMSKNAPKASSAMSERTRLKKSEELDTKKLLKQQLLLNQMLLEGKPRERAENSKSGDHAQKVENLEAALQDLTMQRNEARQQAETNATKME